MKVTYIEHSAFMLEMDQVCFLFDYFKGEVPAISKEKFLFVFASHRHEDHFSPAVFEIEKTHPNIEYILSDDIWQNRVPEELYGKVQFMGWGENLEIPVPGAGTVKIETLRSTDEGVAFWINYGQTTVYHAGDLNDWQWNGESKAWNGNMKAAYHKELEKISGRKANIAFVPVDPRLEENYLLGIDELMNAVDADHIFPMHFWGRYKIIDRLKQDPRTEKYREKICEIHKEGQEIEL